MEISLIGRCLNCVEKKFCNNLRIFIGRHERTIEIVFLVLFFFLQGILVFYISIPIVTLIIIIFLFFLALERIFVHIWLDYERNQLDKKEQELRRDTRVIRIVYNKEISSLKKENEKLKKKLIKL